MLDAMRQQWLHGFLDLCLLCLLGERRDYGLGLAQRLAESGFGEIPGGTLYPSLLRLEKQGLVQADWVSSAVGPRRKYYRLTAEGRVAADERVAVWREFRQAMDRIADRADLAEVETA
ncbi:PadR family transcriptional regulator [Glycomyces algeriensis]|uniref:PadR family transcriptional regulator n=1 Tax=Glycomyces algeriensis TaxID=256037 RepID=A0A9W6G4H6_9ACTN|nr:PadR family transcriptional regulator [Glycomyces algeriensis]MDA1368065.1 PadR family transcriptional regulator [Glycomyces algeriensis]MDR7352577.1 PadR family transcriptional regulator PadR [Glycomyces algeriensis]GLI40255.1 PadR family transcriptional regulator [Glycomyces algeriensis]